MKLILRNTQRQMRHWGGQREISQKEGFEQLLLFTLSFGLALNQRRNHKCTSPTGSQCRALSRNRFWTPGIFKLSLNYMVTPILSLCCQNSEESHILNWSTFLIGSQQYLIWECVREKPNFKVRKRNFSSLRNFKGEISRTSNFPLGLFLQNKFCI